MGPQLHQRTEVWWDNSLILEKVFEHLKLKDLKSASQVCSIWYDESAKLISERSYVFFLDIPSRSIERYLRDREENRVFEGRVLHKRFEFLWEHNISRWMLQPSASFLGEQMIELTITQGIADDVNTLISSLCQTLPNLKRLELRCSHSARYNGDGIQRPNSKKTADRELGLVHHILEILVIELSEYCGIHWDFLGLLVNLQKLGITLFECYRDQEAIVVHQLENIKARLESRIAPAPFDTLDVIVPLPATGATATAIDGILNLLQPTKYTLDLHSDGYKNFPLSFIRPLLEPPASVSRFQLDISIGFSFELDNPEIAQVFQIAQWNRRSQREGFLFRLNLHYSVRCTAFYGHSKSDSVENRFVEIETGVGLQAPLVYVRLGSGIAIDKDYGVLDWTQTLLENANPRYNICRFFKLDENSRKVVERREYPFNDVIAKEQLKPYKLFHLWTLMQPQEPGSAKFNMTDDDQKLELTSVKRWRETRPKLRSRSIVDAGPAKYVFVLSPSDIRS